MSDLDRANLFLNHGRAKHSDSCWRCDEPWPCLTMRVVIDADHEWAQWHDKWIAALDLMGSQAGRAARAEAKVREQAEEIERLKAEHLSTIRNMLASATSDVADREAELTAERKQTIEQHQIVQDLGRELRAERERGGRLSKHLDDQQGLWSREKAAHISVTWDITADGHLSAIESMRKALKGGSDAV